MVTTCVWGQVPVSVGLCPGGAQCPRLPRPLSTARLLGGRLGRTSVGGGGHRTSGPPSPRCALSRPLIPQGSPEPGGWGHSREAALVRGRGPRRACWAISSGAGTIQPSGPASTRARSRSVPWSPETAENQGLFIWNNQSSRFLIEDGGGPRAARGQSGTCDRPPAQVCGSSVTLLALWGCLGWTLVLVASDHGCRALDGPSLLLLRNWRLATVWGAGAAHA